MNLRATLSALTLGLSSLVAVPAFAQAQTYVYAQPPLATATVVQPGTQIVAQPPVMARPAPSMIAIRQNNFADPQMQARRQTAEFSAHVQAQAEQIEQQIRTNVARGWIRPVAIREANLVHLQLNAALARSTRDGTIDGRDQRRINNLLERMSRIESQYRINFRGRH